MRRMQTNRELLETLRDGLEELPVFDKSELDRLMTRGEMLVRRIFGSDSRYIQKLASIEFSRSLPIAISSSRYSNFPSQNHRRQAQEQNWRSGQTKAVN